ncbi:MAG: hypothetical protein IIV41_03120 [Akkermansia sp.]|nr:hypothetical protein [Akkermansia sp.]
MTRLRPFGFAVAGDIRFCEPDDILPGGQGDIRALGTRTGRDRVKTLLRSE